MGILTASRVAADAVLRVDGCEDVCEDVLMDDPLWSVNEAAAHWRVLVGECAPVLPWVDDEEVVALPVTLPVTRRGQLAELQRLAAEQARCAAREAAVLVALTGAAPRSREVSITDPQTAETRAFAIVDEVLEEVSVALRRSVGTVRRDVALARRLAALPATVQVLESGVISPAHAEVIARIADGLPARVLAGFERRVLAKARVGTPSETGSFARRLRARLDTAGEEARRRAAARHVDVRIWAEDDGLACLQARLPLADAARLHAALEARARAVAFDPEHSMGQRRATALVDAVCGPSGGDRDGESSSGAAPVAVNVTVDLATLLGLVDEPATIDLPGDGPVPMTAAALRDLLADPAVPTTVRRLVVDPECGQLLDRGRTAYRLTDALRAFIIARDGTCRFPHCTRPADHCDIDHITSWRDGGRTDATNLIPLCRRHHVQKTHGHWTPIRRRPDGAVEWQAPDGSIIISHPWRPAREPVLQKWDP